jgi:hypothetical protein
MTLEIRLLRFSTGQPHPLAERPIIHITTKSLLLGHCNVLIEIVGDFLALLITFPWARNEQEDMFFLVRWKKGEAHCVSDIMADSSPMAYIILVWPASVLRVGSLRILQFSFARHPRHPELDPEYTRNSQDRDQERRHPVPLFLYACSTSLRSPDAPRSSVSAAAPNRTPPVQVP